MSAPFGFPLFPFRLMAAMYEGAERERTIQVYVDGILITTWTSSGTTTDFETIVVPSGTQGTVIELQGVLDESEWISIIEVTLNALLSL